MVSELLVPKALHGGLVNDGYFASGVAWNQAEDAVAYTAEVRCTQAYLLVCMSSYGVLVGVKAFQTSPKCVHLSPSSCCCWEPVSLTRPPLAARSPGARL